MTEKPILFSAPMVRAILAGTKMQTRRAVKLPHMNPLGQWEPTTFGGPDGGRTRDGETIPERCALWHTRTGDSICARWLVGDRLWVRETWAYGIHAMAALHDADGPYVYAADGTTQGRLCDRWRPSIHMPRAASRITLEVTGVRVERLQDISTRDCWAEGIPSSPDVDPVHEYRDLWESINGPGSWQANPWVWVVEFRRVTP